MSKTLKISDDLSLPIDAVTQTLVVYGGKGMGKTNFAAVFAEELSAARLRFSIIDPLGVSWGLRHSADGKSPGIELLILGGLHADIPIEPSGGAVIADLVADEEVDTLIDISRHPNGKMWSMGERIRFVSDYCSQLFQRQGERKRPIMQMIDEAGRFVPQQIPSGAQDLAKCVGAIEQLVEWGRNAAIGVTLITQRSARMNKSVSELADSMFAFRTVGPNSVGAVMDWFGEHVEKERHKDLGQQLRSLPRGKCLIVSPGWLEYEGAVQIRLRHTFDSSRTPEAGERQKKVAAGAKPDLSRYQARMLETIEKAKENDPKLLKQELAKLRAELVKAQKPTPTPAAKTHTKTVEKAVLKDGQLKRAEAYLQKITDTLAKTSELQAQLKLIGGEIATAIAKVTHPVPAQAVARVAPVAAAPARRIVGQRPTRVPVDRGDNANGQISKGERIVLTAVAQYPDGADREQLTVLTGYKRSSRDTYLQRLSQNGYVQQSGDRIIATQEGIDALGSDFEPLPTGDTLREYWMTRLSGGERAILVHLISCWPNAITRDSLDADTGYKRSSRDTYLQRLASRKLIEIVGRGEVKASDMLFEEAMV